MKSMKKVLHSVTGVTFVVGLQDSINDEIVLKFMITYNNKYLCNLHDLSLTLKTNLSEYYNVIVYVPSTRLQLVHPDKTSHSKDNRNDKVEADLVRSSFDNIEMMLELRIDIKVAFVVERLNSDN